MYFLGYYPWERKEIKGQQKKRLSRLLSRMGPYRGAIALVSIPSPRR